MKSYQDAARAGFNAFNAAHRADLFYFNCLKQVFDLFGNRTEAVNQLFAHIIDFFNCFKAANALIKPESHA